MPLEAKQRETARFAWKGLALVIAVELAMGANPIHKLAFAAAVAWAVIGWNAPDSIWAPLFTAAAVWASGCFIWHERLALGWFVPIWWIAGWSPLLGWASLQLRSMKKTNLSPRTSNSVSSKRISPWHEAVRLVLAAAAGVFALHPFLHDGILGGDDAKWYASVVADTIEQWRHGLWPVFIGQTRFAAIGTVLPLRAAPLLQHLTVAIDYASFHRLDPYLLLNLAIVTSGAAGGLSSYLCLRSILPMRRAEALLISILYVWSPGVIGLPYTGQLFMSAMTLPFLPVVFLGIYRVFLIEGISGWLLAATGCAGCWLAHSPIGLWATAITALAIAIRWCTGVAWNRWEIMRIASFGVVFASLCGYVFVSIASLTPPDSGHTRRTVLIENVHNTFPAVLQPVTRYASEVTDLQLGWSMYALLALSLYAAVISRKHVLSALSAAALLLICLALPVPLLNGWLWSAVPQSVLDVTNAAPTQRLYVILAACASTLAAGCLAAKPMKREKAVILLGIGVLWSGLELRPFLARGAAISNSKSISEDALRADNLLLTRYSLGMLTYDDRFFSNGVMDFGLEQRVLAADLRTYIVSDVATIAPGHDFGRRGVFPPLNESLVGSSVEGERIWVNLDKTVTLEPEAFYLLAIDFTSADWTGILQLKGDGFLREYSIPSSGMEFSFGSGKLSSRVIPLSTTSKKSVDLTLTFINQDVGADLARYHDFARFKLIRYDPAELPIRLKSLAPYVTLVRSPSPGWLETFRCFTPGWSATVNGTPAKVVRSWNGLAAVAIGQGESEVRLSFKPSAILLCSYWLTVVAWACVFLYGIRRAGGRYFA